jgi:hypothetical protein
MLFLLEIGINKRVKDRRTLTPSIKVRILISQPLETPVQEAFENPEKLER